MNRASSKFIFIIGTRAQLIKMAPIIYEFENDNINFKLIMTGQHKETIQELLDEFEINTRPEYIYKGEEISGIASMFWWFPLVLAKLLINRKHYLEYKNDRHIIVHGDTFSTLIGAIFGVLTGSKVHHVESGLRSNNIFHPFPEELTRRICFRLTDVAYCPGEWAYDNMKKFKLERINTLENTLLDAVRLGVNKKLSGTNYVNPYCVASIHRFENIFFVKRFEWIINTLEEISNEYQIVFVLHPATKKQLKRYGFEKRLIQNDRISLVPRMTYLPFLQLMNNSSFVITDGGSNQEELYYLGKPTLIFRKATERLEGLNENAVLSNYDQKTVNNFIGNIGNMSKKDQTFDNTCQPTKIICNHIKSYNLNTK